MVERPPSRFKLKRSTSVDSIQTGLNNLIARMHKSQLMQVDSLNDDYDLEDDTFFDVNRKADPFSSLCMKKEPLFVSGQKSSNRIGNAMRNNVAIRNENLSKEEALLKRSPRRSTSHDSDHIKYSKEYGQDNVNYNFTEDTCKRSPRRSTSYDGDYIRYSKERKHADTNQQVTDEPRIRSPRRSTSYDEDHNKRVNDRKQAREIAANLVRANKVKKEFYDGNKSFNTISSGKKSAKILKRRNTSAENNTTNLILPAATTPSTATFPVSSSKIRLHTTTTSIPTTTQGTFAARSARHQSQPEKGIR